MGTKPYYFLILVALTIGFVLIPTGEAESEIEIITISHDNAGIENQIDVVVTNNAVRLLGGYNLLRHARRLLLFFQIINFGICSSLLLFLTCLLLIHIFNTGIKLTYI